MAGHRPAIQKSRIYILEVVFQPRFGWKPKAIMVLYLPQFRKISIFSLGITSIISFNSVMKSTMSTDSLSDRFITLGLCYHSRWIGTRKIHSLECQYFVYTSTIRRYNRLLWRTHSMIVLPSSIPSSELQAIIAQTMLQGIFTLFASGKPQQQTMEICILTNVKKAVALSVLRWDRVLVNVSIMITSTVKIVNHVHLTASMAVMRLVFATASKISIFYNY